MRIFDFAKYWHARHLAKPELPSLAIKELIELTEIPDWVVNADSEVLTSEGAQDQALSAPISPGSVIVKILGRNGMTQSELAHNLGVSRQMLNLIIRGERTLLPELAIRIEQILGIPAHVLLRLQADYELYRLRHYQNADLRSRAEKKEDSQKLTVDKVSTELSDYIRDVRERSRQLRHDSATFHFEK